MSETSFKMKEISPDERPYEKCWAYGAQVLTDAELLCVILRSGSAGESALALAKRLLDQPDCQGLTGLYHLSAQDLTRIRGIGKVKAIQIKCICEMSRRIARTSAWSEEIFTTPDQIAEFYMEQLRHEEQEHVLLVMLNAAGHRLGEEVIAVGTAHAAAISPREIFLKALSYKASGVIVLHNHPSGDPTPSRQDIQITRQIAESGTMLGIPLLDHIIIGDRCYYSFSAEQIL